MDDELLAAAMLDTGAHAMRNDIATLHMATGLVDDAEVAASITQAVASLRVRLERMVVAARIELGKRPADVELSADELVRLGEARARREGAEVGACSITISPERVTGPGPWLERLAADVLHGDDETWIERLASACGAEVDHAHVRIG